MDIDWSIILFLLIAIGGAVFDSLKKRRDRRSDAATARIVAPSPVRRQAPAAVPVRPAAPAPRSEFRPAVPMPEEGARVTSDTPSPMPAAPTDKARAEALRRHYAYWRKAVIDSEILNSKNKPS